MKGEGTRIVSGRERKGEEGILRERERERARKRENDEERGRQDERCRGRHQTRGKGPALKGCTSKGGLHFSISIRSQV